MTSQSESYLWLLPTVKYKLDGHDLLIYNENKALKIKRLGSCGLNYIKLLNGTMTELDLAKVPVSKIVIPVLEKQGWLVRLARSVNSIIDDRSWLSRQLSYYAHLTQNFPDEIIDSLTQTTVLIIGAGGIGSHVAYSLAASGVGNLIITDRDEIEESNLNRQFLYDKADVGRSKAHVAAEKIRERFKPINTKGIVVDYDAKEIHHGLPKSDIIVLCGEVNSILDNDLLVAQTPLLIAGYIGSQGVVGPLISPNHGTPCLKCIMTAVNRNEIKNIVLNEDARINSWNSSSSTINGIVGQMAAEAVIRLLMGSTDSLLCLNETLLIDMKTLVVTREQVLIDMCEHTHKFN